MPVGVAFSNGMNSEILSIKPLATIPKWIIFALVIVSFVGFLDATYLTAKHYLGTPIECSIFEGCERVTTSPYATVFNIPVALYGALYYLFIFFLSVAYFDTPKDKPAGWVKRNLLISIIPPLAAVGFIASVWFVYLQLFVIKAICLYCMISAATSTALFILGIFVLKYKRSSLKN
ncbi:MAG: hypothetical protein DDT32_01766 [Syntrophomonadaceae bacterium]|nr:hypothetical protein [Bacillota bacterium]